MDRAISESGFFRRLLMDTQFRKSIALASVKIFLTSSRKDFEDAFVSGDEQ